VRHHDLSMRKCPQFIPAWAIHFNALKQSELYMVMKALLELYNPEEILYMDDNQL
jgi:hypothetical protein